MVIFSRKNSAVGKICSITNIFFFSKLQKLKYFNSSFVKNEHGYPYCLFLNFVVNRDKIRIVTRRYLNKILLSLSFQRKVSKVLLCRLYFPTIPFAICHAKVIRSAGVSFASPFTSSLSVTKALCPVKAHLCPSLAHCKVNNATLNYNCFTLNFKTELHLGVSLAKRKKLTNMCM